VLFLHEPVDEVTQLGVREVLKVGQRLHGAPIGA
jgi:hypothetical protein